MPLFKFMKSEHVHYVMERETLRLCRQGYYRRLYETTKDHFRGDNEDGRSKLTATSILTSAGDETSQKLQRLGIIIKGKDTSIGQLSVGATFDYFIYCVARGEFEDLKPAMYTKSEANLEPYDACLELVDEARFHRRLAGLSVNSPSAPAGGLSWKASRFLEVKYADVPGDALSEGHSPLIKRTLFSSQREWRLLFDVHDERGQRAWQDVDLIELHVPGLSECFRIVDAGPSGSG
ncbi:hypothetical protein GOC22_19685 [Sinorhizobium meliloti]|nr:hypothetical protein [Sinorhizobium meliloti]